MIAGPCVYGGIKDSYRLSMTLSVFEEKNQLPRLSAQNMSSMSNVKGRTEDRNL